MQSVCSDIIVTGTVEWIGGMYKWLDAASRSSYGGGPAGFRPAAIPLSNQYPCYSVVAEENFCVSCPQSSQVLTLVVDWPPVHSCFN